MLGDYHNVLCRCLAIDELIPVRRLGNLISLSGDWWVDFSVRRLTSWLFCSTVLRIRNRSFGSGFVSGSGLKLVSDSDLDQKLAKTSFFVLKFLPSLIFKHKKAAFPQLRDLATNKVRSKFAGFGSGSSRKRDGSGDPDPYQKVTDPQHCVQLIVNVFYCTAIVATTVKAPNFDSES